MISPSKILAGVAGFDPPAHGSSDKVAKFLPLFRLLNPNPSSAWLPSGKGSA